jgi:hypothetical protein
MLRVWRIGYQILFPRRRKNITKIFMRRQIGTLGIEKPIGSQLVKKFPAFYGTRKFINAFTNARHLFLS